MKTKNNILFMNKTQIKKALEVITLSTGLILFNACGGGGGGGGVGGGSADTTAPVFTSSTTVSVNENQNLALTLVASDASAVTYEVNSGLFTVDAATGVVTFVTAPNYEKQDSYGLAVKATDAAGNEATQNITITILDVEESMGKFIITVKTDNAGSTSDVEFMIPTNVVGYPAGYNYNVDCDNDGENEATGESANYTCEYDSAGTYTIAIEGDFPHITFNNRGDKDKLTSIDQWGTNVWQSMAFSFYGCSNLAGQASDSPDLDSVGSMQSMFNGATRFNQDIGDWDVSSVTHMGYMFELATAFNQDIGDWDVSSVEHMNSMFFNARAFNQNIGAWSPHAVTRMNHMFNGVTLSPENYKSLLVGWASKKDDLQSGVNFSAGNSKIPRRRLEIGGLITYLPDLAAQSARSELRGAGVNWTITDGD